MKNNKLVDRLFLALIVGVAAWIVFTRVLASPAPVPDVFASNASLNEAVDKAHAAGSGLVVAVATADWCPPCQSYKRGALSDARVAKWITDNAEAVHINVDEHKDAAELLGVRSIPTTVLLRDGDPVSAFTGAVSADTLLAALDEFKSQN